MRHKKFFLLGFCTHYIIYITLHASFASQLSSDHCGGVITNVDEGDIPAPFSYLEPLKCTWILTPSPGHKILINIQQITLLSETEQLFISIDKRPLTLDRHCEICYRNLVAEEVNVTYVSNPNESTTQDEDTEYENENQNTSSELNYTSTASFNISYKSFDPFLCRLPKILDEKAYYLDKNRSIGASLKLACRDPYESSGPIKSTCVVSADFPVPEWDPKPDPKCIVPECNGKTLEKTANRNVGIIVHPGYPAKTLLGGQHCIWRIKAANGRRINLNFKFFSLPTKQKKKGVGGTYIDVFDGSKDNLMVRLESQEESRNLTSKSSVVILELVTANISLKGNDAAAQFGFKIEYVATCNSVPSLHRGSVLFGDDISTGSIVVFQCDVGFNLNGSSSTTCLPDLNWSHPMPICIPGNETSVANKGKKQNEGANHQNANAKEIEKGEGSVKVNKKKPTNDVTKNLLPSDDESAGEVKSGTVEDNDFTLLIIILAVVVPVVVVLLTTLGCFLWYRKQYPVRMGLGRKFETFENPAYERKRNKTTTSDDPAELQKLTSLPTP